MAKYAIEDTTLRAVADPLREIAGKTVILTPGQMATEAETASAELDVQAGLIEAIMDELDGKAAGGGNGGGTQQTPAAGDNPVVENAGLGRINATSLTSTGISITIPVSGTYRIKWSAFRTSTSGTNSTRLYRTRNGQTTAIGTDLTSWTNSYYINGSLDVQLNAGDVITVYARSRGSSYYVCAGNLSACVAQPHILVD